MIEKYPPIEGELSPEAAACQAAYALDSSATIAQQQRDHTGLLAVGEAWMKLADFLAALRQSDEKPEKARQPFGFQPEKVDLTDGATFELQDIEEEELEDVRDADED